MDPHDLTIEFHGICTHFVNTVPAVPHRVAIPQTSQWRPGVLTTPEHPTPAPYVLEPHLAYAYFVADGELCPLEVPGAIKNGWIYTTIRLHIPNASDRVLEYPSDRTLPEVPFADIPRVGEYATNYRYSDDVIFGGRVQCYFDLFRGTVVGKFNGKALRTIVRKSTEGPPRLRVTRLAPHAQPEPFFDDVPLPLGSTLVVGNSNIYCKHGRLDFLWHLLTAEGSIPQHLPKRPYGQHGAVPEIDRVGLISRLGELLDHGYPGPLDFPPGVPDTETAASCSNSQWP